MKSDCKFKESLCSLHRVKSSAYGEAWRKRGEVLSILANIARKVDRIDNVVSQGAAFKDESPLDTTVDLLVYSLKYQTYLADEDDNVAKTLFGNYSNGRPFSKGTSAFEYLVRVHLDLSCFDVVVLSVPQAAKRVIECFEELESCFTGVRSMATASLRQSRTEALSETALQLLAAIRAEEPSLHEAFINEWLS